MVSWAHSYCKENVQNRLNISCDLKIWTHFKARNVTVPKLVEQISVFTEATLFINKSERASQSLHQNLLILLTYLHTYIHYTVYINK
jgi:hypothetical protein